MLLRCRAVVNDVGDHAMPEVRTSEALMSCVGLTLSFHGAHKLSIYFSLWRPLALLPSTLPGTTKFSRPCLLKTCPRKASCCWRILFISVRCTPAFLVLHVYIIELRILTKVVLINFEFFFKYENPDATTTTTTLLVLELLVLLLVIFHCRFMLVGKQITRN